MNLLDSLDAAYARTQSPDGIAALINTGDVWIRLSEMTEAYWNKHKDVPCKVAWIDWQGNFLVRNWLMRGYETLDQCKHNCRDADYWVIPLYLYQEDSRPLRLTV